MLDDWGMSMECETLLIRIDATVLKAVRILAEKEGRVVDSIVEEALGDFLAKHEVGKADGSAMAAYLTSHERFGKLYRKLAE